MRNRKGVDPERVFVKGLGRIAGGETVITIHLKKSIFQKSENIPK